MQEVTCCRCDVNFGLSDDYYRKRKQDHKSFSCPNGHEQCYLAQSDVEKLQGELTCAKRRAVEAMAATRTADYARRAYKGYASALRRDIAAGVCPCCKQKFLDLLRHMERHHPGFVKTEKGKE